MFTVSFWRPITPFVDIGGRKEMYSVKDVGYCSRTMRATNRHAPSERQEVQQYNTTPFSVACGVVIPLDRKGDTVNRER